MDSKDLMIGDWVLYNGDPIRVEEIITRQMGGNCINGEWETAELYDAINTDDIQPIPLTPEILEKNGFERVEAKSTIFCYPNSKTNMQVYLDDYPTDGWYLNIRKSVKGSRHIVLETQITYVHQLQHALRLCGIEKTIEL